MAPSYSFSIVRLAAERTRDERINIGLIVFNPDSVDVRLPRRLDKVRALSAAIDVDVLAQLVRNLSILDEKNRDAGVSSIDARYERLADKGPLALSALGTFLAENATAYEERIGSILRAMIEVEPAPVKIREKRSKLLTQVKRIFRQERVLAKKDDNLDSHRILPGFVLDDGLVADLVLKNGAIHVVETVDASGDSDSLRKAIADISIAALVLERARMKFSNTKTKLVYEASSQLEKITRPSLDAAEHQGTELINWASADQRNKFIHNLSSLATPIENRKSQKFVMGADSRQLNFSVSRGVRKLNLGNRQTPKLPKPKK